MDFLTIFGLVGTFLVPFVVVFVERYLAEKDYKPISAIKNRAVSGQWKGFAMQAGEKRPISVNFRVKRRKVLGSGTIFHANSEDARYQIVFEGGFKNEFYLSLNYNNIDNEIIQFGVAILRVSANRKKITGESVGFGHESENIVHGIIELEKDG